MQIFERISRIIKSNSVKSVDGFSYIDDEEDELKKIIDELNSSKNFGDERRNDKNQSKSEFNPQLSEIEKAYQTLGISPESDDEFIKTIYRKKMKEFHPDKVSHLSDEVRKKAEARAKDINEAYLKIKKQRGL